MAFNPSIVLCLLYGPLGPLCDMLFFLLFREMIMLFRCFAKHVLPKRAISRNCETSETTHLVSRNSKTRQKPNLRWLWSCAMRYPCQNKTVFRMALPTVYALTLFRFILSRSAKFRRTIVDFFAISAKFKLNSGEIHL
jgi:hypothetical protein